MKYLSLIVLEIVTFISGFIVGIRVPIHYWILSLAPVAVAFGWCLMEIDD